MPIAVGGRVRVRVPAREVILATRRPEGLSLHNVLAAVVTAVHTEPSSPHAVVQVAVGNARLLAEVTRDALVTLGIAPGQPVFALIKSVSLEVAATE
jgi:molybdate transport system ATP-binding protein